MNVIRKLRIKLALWFFFLVMAAYILAGFASFWGITNRLHAATINDLVQMCEEIAPAVDYSNHRPTLANWMLIANERHVLPQTTIQLFNAQKKLLESYGPKGAEILEEGKINFTKNNKKASVYSHYISLPEGCFVQVQLPTTPLDQAIGGFLLNEFLRGATLALLLAIFGWFYAGRAVAPVAKSFRTLRTFVDDAGHELNTPVALIENSIETIEAHLRDHNLSTDVLKIIQRASNTLKGIAQNLLLLAKMEQPHLVLAPSPVNLIELVTDVVYDFGATARAKQINLEISTDSQIHQNQDVFVMGDRNMLIEVFNNLIANAIRYTPEGGQISIHKFRTDNNVSIAIKDTGCGIPKESLPHVFDRFYRVDKARSRREGGSGLGLAIVKAIVRAHKGTVRVESEIGKGSNFFVTLPVVGTKQLQLVK